MNLTQIAQKLQNLTNLKITQAEIGRALDIDRSSVNMRIKRGTEIKISEIKKLAEYFRVSENAILSDERSNTMVNIGGIVFDAEKLTTKQEAVEVIYYPDIYASCGNGVLVQSENCKKISVPRSVFFTKVYDNKTYFVITAYGNSMSPFIEDNDKLIVEKYEGEQIIDNRAYLFSYENEIFIKRLVKNVNQLVIISDNKDFDVIKLSGEDITKVSILGQVVGIMRDVR